MKLVQRIAEALDRLEEKTAKIEYEKSLTYQDHVEFQVYFLCGDDPMLAPIGQQLRAG